MTDARILVVDDHPLFREAMKLAVQHAAPGAWIVEAGGVRDALSIAEREALDLILLDLKMADADGFSGLSQLRATSDGAILIVSGAEDRQVQNTARALGAIGFLPKSATFDMMAQTIRGALDGADLWLGFADSDLDAAGAHAIAELTPTQLKVLNGILRGRLNKQIAFDLGISEATVKAHVTALMRKLNVRSRTQAVIAARALAESVGLA